MIKRNKILVIIIFCTFVFPNAWGITVDEFPNQVIIVGTHVLNINGITSEHIEIANKSVEYEKDGQYFTQDKIYYKSEFSDGTWYEITKSKSIDEVIGSRSNIVSLNLIKGLYLTHYTNEKGETLDLLTNKKVMIHNISSYRDPQNITPEIEPLTTQAKSTKEELDSLKKQSNKNKDDDELKDKVKTREKEKKSLDNILGLIDSGELDKLEDILSKYDKYLIYLKNKLKVNEDILKIAQEQKDFYIKSFQKTAVQVTIDRISKEAESLDREKSKDIIDMIYDVSNKLSSKLMEIENSIEVQEATDTLDSIKKENLRKIYYLIMDLKYDDTLEYLNEMIYIDNIYENKIIEIDGELQVLDKATSMVFSDIKKKTLLSDTDMYKEMKKNGESKYLLESVIDTEIKDLDEMIEDFIFLKDSKIKRLEENDKMKDFLKNLLTKVEDVQGIMDKEDDFYEGYKKEIEKLIDNLNKSLAEIASKEDPEIQEMEKEKLQSENDLSQLKEAYLKAVESGNMNTAKDIKEAMEVISMELEDSEAGALTKLSELLNKKEKDGLSADEEGKLTGYKNQLSAIDKNLLNSYLDSFDDLVKSIDDNDIVNLANKYDLFTSLGDKLKGKLKDEYLENKKDKIIALLNSEYGDLIAKGMYDDGKVIMEIINPDYVDDSAKLGKDDEGLLKLNQLLDNSYTLSKLEKVRDKLEKDLMDLNSQMLLARDNFGDKNALYNQYLEKLEEYMYSYKENLIIKILVIERFSETSEGILNMKKDYIRDLKEFENKKYSKDDIRSILSIESSISDKYGYISSRDFVMIDFNVALHYPVIKEGKNYFIPVRTLYETYGGIVQWNDEKQEVSITNKEDFIKFSIGSKDAYISGEKYDLKNEVILDNDKTYIPVGFVKDYYKQNIYAKDNIFVLYNKEIEDIVTKIMEGE